MKMTKAQLEVQVEELQAQLTAALEANHNQSLELGGLKMTINHLKTEANKWREAYNKERADHQSSIESGVAAMEVLETRVAQLEMEALQTSSAPEDKPEPDNFISLMELLDQDNLRENPHEAWHTRFWNQLEVVERRQLVVSFNYEFYTAEAAAAKITCRKMLGWLEKKAEQAGLKTGRQNGRLVIYL